MNVFVVETIFAFDGGRVIGIYKNEPDAVLKVRHLNAKSHDLEMEHSKYFKMKVG